MDTAFVPRYFVFMIFLFFIEFVGTNPPKQYGGSVHLVNDHLVIMPGNHGFDIMVPQIFALDLISLEWKTISVSEGLDAAGHYHAGCSRGTLIVIHGGYEKALVPAAGGKNLESQMTQSSSAMLVELKGVRFMSWSFGDATDLVSKNLDALSKESTLAQSTVENLKAILWRVYDEERRLGNAMKAREKQLESRIALFEREKESLRCVDTKASKIVTLDVGGVIYKTTIGTLTKCDGSMLASMFSGRHKIDLDSPVFFDRDGRHFHVILNHLRNFPSSVLPEDLLVLKELLQEAKYYLLGELENDIRTKMSALSDGGSKQQVQIGSPTGSHITHLSTERF